MAQDDDGSGSPGGLLGRLRGSYELLARELAKFGVIGGLAFVVDTGTYNLLRFAGPDGEGVLSEKPLTAKVASAALATLFAWLGNRYWTFRHRHQPGKLRELVLFGVMNVCGLLISLVCLGFTYYVLGLRSPLAENISANVVGVALGTAFRFYAYRTFVFVPPAGRAGPAATVPAGITGAHDVPAALAAAEAEPADPQGRGEATAPGGPAAEGSSRRAHVHHVTGRERGAADSSAR